MPVVALIFPSSRRLRRDLTKVLAMKMLFLPLFAILMASPVAACPVLSGTWKSDHARTMRYVDHNVKLPDKTRSFVSQLMGRMTATFGTNEVTYRMDAWTATVGGEKHEMDELNESVSYRILHCNDKVVVTTTKSLITGREQVVVYNFDGSDTMWVNVGGADSELPDSALREYFSRVKMAN
jgi:hypothetical protein